MQSPAIIYRPMSIAKTVTARQGVVYISTVNAMIRPSTSIFSVTRLTPMLTRTVVRMNELRSNEHGPFPSSSRGPTPRYAEP